ncbi:MAG: histidine--tRNA ligase [Ruminococcus sp.]|nr:histidine--tRNA ligase [Candidatus Copronaster equi]
MALITQAIKGTQDVLPKESYKNQFVERTMLEIAEEFGFKEIRTPVFEHTELFTRSVGDTTDVVQKEMYTFDDKGGRSITLRPEGTAGAARAFLEHGLQNEPMPQKVSYLTSCYRYEKPQAGRLREFHQFGVECYGAASPAADAEVISLGSEIFGFLGIDRVSLEINSIGCPECRKEYQKALKEYFNSHKDELCPTCLDRLDRNPMRILDCKSPVCHGIAEEAPVILDYLCDECREHFEQVKAYLEEMGISFEVNPRIVRGLDYYTRTVFEFVTDALGSQSAVCAGGRYDGLIEEIGGPHIPALGFGLGIERLLLLLEAQGIELPESERCEIYIGNIGQKASLKASQLALELRQSGISAQFDVIGRSVKAQMKYADKIQARFTTIIGDDDIEANVAKVKNMDNGETCEIPLDDFADEFMEISLQQAADELQNIASGEEEIDLSKILGGLI